MEKFTKLSRTEMREITGGLHGGCIASECAKDSDCSSSKYGPVCQLSTCASTGLPANYCYAGGA